MSKLSNIGKCNSSKMLLAEVNITAKGSATRFADDVAKVEVLGVERYSELLVVVSQDVFLPIAM
ncbi:MAG: hypothetical protein IPN86_17845 [Saprospiraceae bacterium]|nr:hypothetical protein [Saprospiraceae bacterium]